MIRLRELAPEPNVFCAWCRAEGKTTPLGYEPGLKPGETSDGICKKHEIEFRKQYDLD